MVSSSYLAGSGVAAADAKQATAGLTIRTGVLAAESTTDAGHTALAAGSAAWTTVLTSGSAGSSVGGTSAAARVQLVNDVGRSGAGPTHTRIGRSERHDCHRRGDCSTDNDRFHNTEFGHVRRPTLCTDVQNIEF